VSHRLASAHDARIRTTKGRESSGGITSTRSDKNRGSDCNFLRVVKTPKVPIADAWTDASGSDRDPKRRVIIDASCWKESWFMVWSVMVPRMSHASARTWGEVSRRAGVM